MWKKPLRDVKKFCTREKKKPSVKIFEKCSFPSREKKTHPWKNPKKCPWKFWTAREKFEKSVRESDFAIREKNRKKAENGFHGHFWFSRGKKKHWK